MLHALRVLGIGASGPAADLALLDIDEVEATLAAAEAAGWVTEVRSPRLNGFKLSPLGRQEGERLASEELDAVGGRAEVQAHYEEFLALNPTLLGLCGDWQTTSPTTLNEHRDRAYDAGVLAGLHELHDRARPMLEGLAAVLERYGRYGTRLAAALAKLDAGDNDWFTKPLIDSYHTVWFQLHEDLLATLGIDRASEAQP